MINLDVCTPSLVLDAFKQLIAIPYYKVDENTYAFATHILEDTGSTDDKTGLQILLSGDAHPDMSPIFQKAVRALSEHTITAADFLTWSTYHKAKGTVMEYQHLLASTYHEVLSQSLTSRLSASGKSEDVNIADMQGEPMPFDTEQDTFQQATEQVLNHNNPFADISIQNQQFIYSSDTDQFGTLSLNTSHTVARVQHDEDTSYLVIQPGFKIKTANNVQMASPQEVLFDDTLTSEIAQQDDNIYVYMN